MAEIKILVADDSKTIRILTERLLSQAGYRVIMAENGQEALELTRIEKPHLVILDIQMPVMDGYEACDKILQLPEVTSTMRIIFLTCERGCHLDQLGRQFGAYLPKPLDGELLLSTIRHLLAGGNPAPQALAFV